MITALLEDYLFVLQVKMNKEIVSMISKWVLTHPNHVLEFNGSSVFLWI